MLKRFARPVPRPGVGGERLVLRSAAPGPEADGTSPRSAFGGLPPGFPYPSCMRETDFLTQGPTPIGTHGNAFATPPEPAPRTKRWTADEDAVMHEWYGQLSVREIRQRFLPQRSVAGICARAERLELTGATRNAWTAPELSNLKTF